ncbi:MAG: hypothetical protein U1B83_00630 [Candidatus Cloacimonadaceae bacterium]|nr:hypothetical protein [Candidatus Cloacimonadaceae bacterium]
MKTASFPLLLMLMLSFAYANLSGITEPANKDSLSTARTAFSAALPGDQIAIADSENTHLPSADQSLELQMCVYEGAEYYTSKDTLPFDLSRYMDASSSSEFLLRANHDKDVLYQFNTANMLRVKWSVFGIEASSMITRARDRYLIFGDDRYLSYDYSLSRFSFGAGLPDPEFVRLFFELGLNSYARTRTIDYPVTIKRTQKTSFTDFTFSLGKTARTDIQKLDAGVSYQFDPGDRAGFEYTPTLLTEVMFDHDDLAWRPNWRFHSYLYVSDLLSGNLSPNYLGGMAHSTRPLIFVHNSAYLLGARLNIQKQDHRFTNILGLPERKLERDLDFSALLYKNLGGVMGFDLDYIYSQSKNEILDTLAKSTELSADLRLTLIAQKPLNVITVIEYAYRKQQGSNGTKHFDDLNAAAYFIFNFGEHFCLSAYAQYNTLWNVAHDFFKLDPLNYHTSLSLAVSF